MNQYQSFYLDGSLSIFRGEEVFLNATYIRILKQIITDGSIHAATKSLKISYQHAWHLLDKVNQLSLLPVLIRPKGGRDGDGCIVSSYWLKKTVLSLAFLLMVIKISAQKVTIAAASDLRYALDEIVVAYKKVNPKSDIQVTYGSSGNAYQQIINGAPFDIFFSADILYPNKLKAQGLTASNPKLYAIGFIVLWSNQIDVSKGISTLSDSKISKIAIANPDHAPYGKRAEQFLKYYKLYNGLKTKLIRSENISQAAQFAQTGNAEVGILALSLVLSPTMKNQGKYFLIDSKSYSPLEQAYVIIKKPTVNTEANKFARFIATPTARTIFKSYGFKLPRES